MEWLEFLGSNDTTMVLIVILLLSIIYAKYETDKHKREGHLGEVTVKLYKFIIPAAVITIILGCADIILKYYANR